MAVLHEAEIKRPRLFPSTYIHTTDLPPTMDADFSLFVDALHVMTPCLCFPQPNPRAR